MQGILAKVRGVQAFCVLLVLALCAAPAFEAAHHGPGALAVEADHHAHGPGHDHDHEHGGQLHDSGDHDHVSVALLTGDGAASYPEPGRVVLAGPGLGNGTPPDSPKRPPRPVMI